MLIQDLSKYLKRYFSTKLIFLLDMIMSFGASVITLYLMNIITVRDLLALKPACLWLGGSLFFSFIFILVFRTNRIIIRHTTIREFAKFAHNALPGYNFLKISKNHSFSQAPTLQR